MVVSPGRKEKEDLEKKRVARFLTSCLDGGGRLVVVKVKPMMLVTLKVQDTDRRVVKRTMLRTDKLQVLMDHYYDVVCSAGAATRGAGRFVFDGKRLKGESTPDDLGMVNGDKIDVFEDLMSG